MQNLQFGTVSSMKTRKRKRTWIRFEQGSSWSPLHCWQTSDFALQAFSAVQNLQTSEWISQSLCIDLHHCYLRLLLMLLFAFFNQEEILVIELHRQYIGKIHCWSCKWKMSRTTCKTQRLVFWNWQQNIAFHFSIGHMTVGWLANIDFLHSKCTVHLKNSSNHLKVNCKCNNFELYSMRKRMKFSRKKKGGYCNLCFLSMHLPHCQWWNKSGNIFVYLESITRIIWTVNTNCH